MVAASSRGLGENVIRKFRFNSSVMGLTARPIKPGDLYKNWPDFEDA
jgi:hypothetical protein